MKQGRETTLEDRRGKRKKDQTPRTELEKAQIEIEQLKHKLYPAEMDSALCTLPSGNVTNRANIRLKWLAICSM